MGQSESGIFLQTWCGVMFSPSLYLPFFYLPYDVFWPLVVWVIFVCTAPWRKHAVSVDLYAFVCTCVCMSLNV